MKPVQVFDDVLPDPHGYREEALRLPFGDVPIGEDTWRGVALLTDTRLEACVRRLLFDPDGVFAPVITLSFFRRSPAGQEEPNYIHSDADMGRWTGIYYMNPDPPPGDGTHFWERTASGSIAGPWDEEVAAAAKDPSRWHVWHRVEAKFNRLLVFQSDLFHSRALMENYGVGDDSRLIQVVFGGWR